MQTVRQHSEHTAQLCRDFAILPLKNVLYAMGLLHDVGKYTPAFQRRINGSGERAEHAVCGAKAAADYYKNAVCLLLQYCIAGHHAGIPDAGFPNDTPDQSTLFAGLQRDPGDFSIYRSELSIPNIDEAAFADFLMQHCAAPADLVEKFAFFTRYCFSCLTDADSLDTEQFCTGVLRKPLTADFQKCLALVNSRLDSFVCKTDLQRARAVLQRQVFDKANRDSEIYLMNMPTGSGKTLCSIKFALERATKKGREKKRIIYIIPYNSIIEQTAAVLEDMFGAHAQILRHQSTFSYDDCADYSEDYKVTAKLAAENWDAQLVITTAVQFFESVYANKRGKLRKLHNMADSILIFDEAHLMPQNYLQPCLRAISYITKDLNSEAVFLTATMPDFKQLIRTYAMPESEILDLIDDMSAFPKFGKCRYFFAGVLSDALLLQRAGLSPSALIVVNSRRSAKRLYAACGGEKYHLSTYMTAFDRKRVIAQIRNALAKLESDYPDLKNVPDSRRITVVSTCLIEAGVDLDFYAVFRELSGLDNILQAGGRCNREGKRKAAEVCIFESESSRGIPSADERGDITKGLLAEFEDITCPASIKAYYSRLFFARQEDLIKNAISQSCGRVQSIPFRSYSENFELIPQNTVSVVVARDAESARLIQQMQATGIGNSRKLQKYTFSVYRYEFDDLLKQGVINDYGSGIYCLTNPDYYDENTGVEFEGKDIIF